MKVFKFLNVLEDNKLKGVTWDVNQHLMLRAEYSHRDGTYVLSPRENPLSELERKWHYFALQIAVRF